MIPKVELNLSLSGEFSRLDILIEIAVWKIKRATHYIEKSTTKIACAPNNHLTKINNNTLDINFGFRYKSTYISFALYH
jgi:hypothetical protein